MKTKDILIGIVLGMMIAGAIAQTGLRVISVDVDKDKIDEISKPYENEQDTIDRIVDEKTKTVMLDKCYAQCRLDIIGTTTTLRATTTTRPTTTIIPITLLTTTVTMPPITTTTTTTLAVCHWDEKDEKCVGTCGKDTTCVEKDVGVCECRLDSEIISEGL